MQGIEASTTFEPILESGIFHSGSIDGRTIDIAGFHSLLWAIQITALAGTYSVDLEHSLDAVTWEKIPQDEIQGNDPAITTPGRVVDNSAASSNLLRIGLLSKRRYQRAVVVDEGSSGTLTYGILILGKPKDLPARAPGTYT